MLDYGEKLMPGNTCIRRRGRALASIFVSRCQPWFLYNRACYCLPEFSRPKVPFPSGVCMFRSHSCYCVLCSMIALVLAWLLLANPVPSVYSQESKGPVSFINQVAPILKENCFACHDAKKKKGKLEMTTFESFRKGGTKDDPVTPGKPRES